VNQISTEPIGRDIFNYSVLALPLAFVGLPLYIHAPDFYATHQGVSLSLLAMLLLGLRVFDAVQDPIIGIVSDRLSAHRFPLMLASLAVLAISFYALFTPPDNNIALWFAAMMLLATSAFSILTVNLNALGALWSNDASQQSRITTWREGCALLGLTCAVVFPSLLQQKVSVEESFSGMGLLLIILSALAFWRFAQWYKAHSKQAGKGETQTRHSFWRIIKQTSPALRKFYAIYAVSMVASAMPAVLVLFFIRDLLGLEEYAGLFLLTYFLAGVVAMPLWKNLSQRYGSESAWLISMLIAVVSFIGAFFLGQGDMVAYLIICLISGAALGGDLSLPPAVLAAHIHSQNTQHSASSQFALLTFLSKTALALAAILTLPLLEKMGFVAASDNSAAALMALSIVYALIPCLMKITAAFMLWRFVVKGERNEKDYNSNNDRSGHHAQ